MFLLRCAFWLSIVYAAMVFGLPWQAAPRDGALAAAVRGEGVQLASGGIGRIAAEGAVGGLGRLCAGRGLDCVRDAAGLTALVETAIAVEPDYSVEAAHPAARAPTTLHGPAAAVPMPVRDPRRHGSLRG